MKTLKQYLNIFLAKNTKYSLIKNEEYTTLLKNSRELEKIKHSGILKANYKGDVFLKWLK